MEGRGGICSEKEGGGWGGADVLTDAKTHSRRGSAPDLVEGLVLVPVGPTSPPAVQQLSLCCDLLVLTGTIVTLHV